MRHAMRCDIIIGRTMSEFTGYSGGGFFWARNGIEQDFIILGIQIKQVLLLSSRVLHSRLF